MTLKKNFRLICITILLFFVSVTVFAENPKGNHRLSAGARWHKNHSVFDELPFDDGDISYLMAYEYHEGIALWQVGVDYAKNPDGDKDVKRIYTPQLNLIFKDRIFRAGTGILKSFMTCDQESDRDTSIYYQFILGLDMDIPFLNNFTIGLNGHYAFQRWKWDKLKEFSGKDIEYSVLLGFQF